MFHSLNMQLLKDIKIIITSMEYAVLRCATIKAFGCFSSGQVYRPPSMQCVDAWESLSTANIDCLLDIFEVSFLPHCTTIKTTKFSYSRWQVS
jgi:hypothetical protein